jgi:hypothetical protein
MKKFLIVAISSYLSFACHVCCFADYRSVNCTYWKGNFTEITEERLQMLNTLMEKTANNSITAKLSNLEMKSNALQGLIEINCQTAVEWGPAVATYAALVSTVTMVVQVITLSCVYCSCCRGKAPVRNTP